MKASEQAQLIGKKGLIKDTARPLGYQVKVLDVKEVWGTHRYLVTPVNGAGQAWVLGSKVNFELQRE